MSFSWKSCYPQHIRIYCMPFLHGAICLRCFTCIFIQTINHSCMLSLSTSLTKSFKKSRPISLWDLNPLVLDLKSNSFTISELQLRVFQIKNREDELYSIIYFMSSSKQLGLAFLDFHHRLDIRITCFQHTQLGNLASTQHCFTANFRLPPVFTRWSG